MGSYRHRGSPCGVWVLGMRERQDPPSGDRRRPGAKAEDRRGVRYHQHHPVSPLAGCVLVRPICFRTFVSGRQKCVRGIFSLVSVASRSRRPPGGAPESARTPGAPCPGTQKGLRLPVRRFHPATLRRPPRTVSRGGPLVATSGPPARDIDAAAAPPRQRVTARAEAALRHGSFNDGPSSTPTAAPDALKLLRRGCSQRARGRL